MHWILMFTFWWSWKVQIYAVYVSKQTKLFGKITKKVELIFNNVLLS